MMDDLKRMVVFSHVVQSGSFTGAAKRLGIAKSAVSKHVSLLEQNIGARLLNRSTRKLSLTDIGESYFQNCVRLMEVMDDAKQCTDALQNEPQGNLKISCPASFGIDHVAPLLNRFLHDYPRLNAELLLDDNVVDMTEQGIDIAIRVGWLPDSSLRARKLKDAGRLLCASPEYIEQAGMVKTPEGLVQHEWIIFTRLPTPHHYVFTRNDKNTEIKVKGRLKTNNASVVRRLLLDGAGIAVLSEFLVNEDLEAGRLVHLLPDYHLAAAGIYAVYQNRRLQQTKIRKFIDFLAENL